MLRATLSTSSKQAQKYFNESLAQSDYYQEQGKTLGIWGGAAAELLGLQGAVEKSQFRALTENRHPQTGQKLSSIDRADRRIGTDFTFSGPKSYSLAALQDPELEPLLMKAVHQTMAIMEAHVQARVRGKEATREDENRNTGNWVYAAFHHSETRPLPDGTSDPHHHVHAYAFNLTHDAKSEKWKAAQLGTVMELLPYYQACFHAQLAHEVQQLGYGITTDGKGGWQITGIRPETMERFSRRTAEIEAEAQRKNIQNAKLLDRLGALTRRKKLAQPLSPEQQRKEWLGRLNHEERESLHKLKGQRNVIQVTNPEQAVKFALEHHLERSSTVDLYTLKTTALKQALGVCPPSQVKEAIHAHKDLVWGKHERPHLTTQSVYHEEQSVIRFAREGLWAYKPLGVADAQESKPQVKELLNSRHCISLVIGYAGTGKTSLIQASVRQMEQSGQRVFLFAPTAEASRGVLASEGFTNAETIARLLTDKQLQTQTKGAVLWVDEAGLMSNPQFYALCKLAKQNGNRLVLSGDEKQHGSVIRGAPLDLLRRYTGIEPIQLHEIKRQRGTYKDAVQDIVNGKVDSAFRKLEQLSSFQELKPQNQYGEVADSYLKALEQKQKVLVVCPTHAEGEAVTNRIRKALQGKGLLGKEEHSLLRLQAVDSTEAQRKQAQLYKPLQVIQFNQNAKGFTKGQRAVVKQVEANQVKVLLPSGEEKPLPLQEAQRFSVYEQKPLKLAVGDKVRITETLNLNGKRLNNGSQYEVVAFDKLRNPILNNGLKLPLDAGHVNHAYTLTSHASQGKTVDKVLVVQSSRSFGPASLNQFYVSVSRGRKAVEIFTDDKAQLLKAVRNPELRRLASELQPNRSPTLGERLRTAVQGITTRLRQAVVRNQHRSHYQSQQRSTLTHGHAGQVR